jgi:hypothetical protein
MFFRAILFVWEFLLDVLARNIRKLITGRKTRENVN